MGSPPQELKFHGSVGHGNSSAVKVLRVYDWLQGWTQRQKWHNLSKISLLLVASLRFYDLWLSSNYVLWNDMRDAFKKKRII